MRLQGTGGKNLLSGQGADETEILYMQIHCPFDGPILQTRQEIGGGLVDTGPQGVLRIKLTVQCKLQLIISIAGV